MSSKGKSALLLSSVKRDGQWIKKYIVYQMTIGAMKKDKAG